MSRLLCIDRRASYQTGAVGVQSCRLVNRSVIATASAAPDLQNLPSNLRDLLTSPTGSQLTAGTFLGFATGYAAKRIGQALLVVVGLQVVALQVMAKRGWLVVDWDKITDDMAPHMRQDGVDRVWDLVKYRVPFAGSFTAGCFAGFRWS